MALDLRNPRTLSYSANVEEKYVLLEVDEKLLQEVLAKGAVFKAPSAEDETVLCTGDKTYQVKNVGTSNLLLLVAPDSLPDEGGTVDDDGMLSQPEMDDGLQTQLVKNRLLSKGHSKIVVDSKASRYLELVETAPRFDQLEAVLAERPLGSPEDRRLSLEASTSGLYSFGEVLARVQASEGQLREAMRTLKAVELDGFVRSLHPDLTLELLELLILTAREMGHPLTAIPYDEVMQALSLQAEEEPEYREELFDHCLRTLATETEEGSGLYRLEAQGVCLLKAIRILRGAESLPLSTFVARWKAECPEELQPQLAFLQGHALIDRNARGEEVIRYFSVLDLPRDPSARFRAIFAARPSWLLEDLEPYLQGLQVVGQSKEGLLLKYTRSSQVKPSEPIYYSQRYDFQ